MLDSGTIDEQTQFRNTMRLDCKFALTFMLEPPSFRRAWLWGGLILLFCPPVGWPIALGYRSLTLRHLLKTGQLTDLKLPEDAGKCFVSGLGAVSVIFLYFLPFLTLYWFFAAPISELMLHATELILFFALIVFLIPVFLPALPFIYAWYFPWIQISPQELAILIVIFGTTVFLMPAVFTQVSLTGSYWGAARTGDALRQIWRQFSLYLEAWLCSLILICGSFIFLPLFPWITFWAYLAIGALFNNVLLFDESRDVRERMRMVEHKFRR